MSTALGLQSRLGDTARYGSRVQSSRLTSMAVSRMSWLLQPGPNESLERGE